MEFSKYLGVADAEECSSSESGWTMYIVSPMHEETNYNNNHHHHHYYHGHGDHDHERADDDDDDDDHGIDKSHGGGDHKMYRNNHEDSDDSMVSDASSRPSRQAILSKKRGGLRRESKHAVSQKQAEKKLYDRRQRAVKEDGYKTTRIDVKARKTN